MIKSFQSAARLSGLFIVFLLLPACAIMQPAPQLPIGGGDQEAFQNRVESMAKVQSWRVKARMASGVIGWSGNLDWQQKGPDLLLTVAGPLGVGGMRAQGTLDYVKVETSDQEEFSGDPEILFRELVGWPFPVKGMRYWSLGIPIKGVKARVDLDADGLLRVLNQSGWQVEYLEYREYLGYTMPRLMRLDNGEISVRVVVDKWLELAEQI